MVGFGRSGQPWSGYDYDTLSDDLASVIKETGATDAVIVGFSMGGEVARYMSRHKGANVSQAGLVSSVVPFMLKTEDNPNGTDQATFEQMTEAMKEDREVLCGLFQGFLWHRFDFASCQRRASGSVSKHSDASEPQSDARGGGIVRHLIQRRVVYH